MKWQKGEPKKAGYYLVAWKTSNSLNVPIIVSELWFNPDAIYHWWTSRGYLRDQQRNNPIDDAMKQEVVAWMPMPEPPKE